MSAVLLAAVTGAAAAALMPTPRMPAPVVPVAPVPVVHGEGWLRRHRVAWSLLAAAGVTTFVGGSAGVVLAPVAAAVVWVAVARAEPVEVRRRREEVRRHLPALVTLLAAALRSGAPPADAVALVSRALPGAAADLLAPVAARLSLGVPPGSVWCDLLDDPSLAPLGRTMARAHETGAPVVAAVERLADELAAAARADIEDRARAIGVRAAVPLGLCLLPSFVLIGIVPLVAALLGTVVA